MNSAFSVRFQIFNTRQPLTAAEKHTKTKLWTELKNIAKRVVGILGDRYAFMDRCEAVIASADQRKQLRSNFPEVNHFIEFNQNHSAAEDNFSLAELKEICTALRETLEGYLGYNISDPEIYIRLSSL